MLQVKWGIYYVIIIIYYNIDIYIIITIIVIKLLYNMTT